MLVASLPLNVIHSIPSGMFVGVTVGVGVFDVVGVILGVGVTVGVTVLVGVILGVGVGVIPQTVVVLFVINKPLVGPE